jgi:phosphoglucomutase
MARTASGEFKTISGNQMGVLLLDYIITAYEENGGLPSDPYAVKTIVSTELATKICAQHGVKLHNVLTGFKFIGEVIKNYEKEGYGSFLLGFEESYGYLKGTYARDKDAVSASLLICEMAAYYKAAGMTLIDALDALYARYGYSFERTEELALDAIHGAEAIKTLMTKLREDAPTEFAGSPVASIGDYMAEVFTDVRTGEKTPTGLPKSNVLYFKTESGDVVVVRPSGTEPKIKFYYLLNGESRTACEAKLEQAKAVIAGYTDAL